MLIYVYVFMHYVYTIVSGRPPYQVDPYAPGRWPYFFVGYIHFHRLYCDIVGDAQRASRCESWV